MNPFYSGFTQSWADNFAMHMWLDSDEEILQHYSIQIADLEQDDLISEQLAHGYLQAPVKRITADDENPQSMVYFVIYGFVFALLFPSTQKDVGSLKGVLSIDGQTIKLPKANLVSLPGFDELISKIGENSDKRRL